MFWRDTICLMGIPVDRVTAGEALGRVFALVQAYAEDRRPRLATSLNADFVVNALSGWRRDPRNPELLHILRNADLVTAGGRPLSWLCRRLGAPLAGHVSGPHLVLSLAREASRRGKSIYLVGTTPEVTRRAADVLKMLFLDLKIAGISAAGGAEPGADPGDAARAEASLCEAVNASGADILLLGLGNPEQELWFHRNCGRLRVPVTVGVDSSFAFVGGDLRPAPPWMQRCSLEWLYRLSCGPSHLWRRYVRDAGNFVLLALPVIWASGRLRRELQPSERRDSTCLTSQLRRLSCGEAKLVFLELPPCLVQERVEKCSSGIVERAFSGQTLVVDASALRFADAAGLGFLMALLRECAVRGLEFYLISQPQVRRVMQMNRVGDLFAPHSCASLLELVVRLEERRGRTFCCMGTEMNGGVRRVWMLGRLTATAGRQMDRLAAAVTEAPVDCVADLSGCAEADSAGLVELVRIANILLANGKRLVLVRVPDSVRKAMQLSGLEDLFEIHPDAAVACAALNTLPPGRRP
jgi:N-acetylglucosaminyldiphosphoundecaprenol N-acetyl-beta-D-mannosaminyltransferase